MVNESAFRKKASKAPLNDWLLVSACVMMFVVLPMLFAWSSMSMIHNRAYGPGFMLLKTHSEPVIPKALVRLKEG
jgi:hypothetical protein